jgi:histidinol dehydrogenase
MKRLDLRGDPEVMIPRPPGPLSIEGPSGDIREVIEEVRARGDEALVEYTERFDGVRLDAGRLRVSPDEIQDAASDVPGAFVDALEEAAGRLRSFCSRHLVESWEAEIGGGMVGEIVHPVGTAGFYVPGGRAVYPSVLMMSAIPAEVAGVPRRLACVPPGPEGRVAAPTLAAAGILGIDEVYRVGGAQAIAAMAFGTETIPRVDVITGGGGLFVALAKREVAGTVAIDSVAGPSEIAVVADASADPRSVAADLIAQAEHGPYGSFVLITWDETLAAAVEKSLAEQLDEIGATPELRETLEAGSVIALVADVDQALSALTRFSPEHAELLFEGAEEAVDRVRSVGAVFVGPWSPVSLGDYAAGSNHTLPTMGAARWASGLRASLYQRVSAVVRYDEESLRASAPYVEAFAEAEGLPLHSRAVKTRFEEDR